MRFIADKNQFGWFYESGLYSSPTGTTLQWLGLIQNHAPDDSTNNISVRYLGNDTRNVGQFNNGPLDHTGTISYFPQDWKMLGFALGSTQDTGTPSPFVHYISEANSDDRYAYITATQFPSFTIEATQVTSTGSNFKRTYNGCMLDSMSINVPQGEIVSVDLNYIGQVVTFATGAPTAVTAPTTRPFLWSDAKVHLPSGTVIDMVKNFTFTVNNNIDAPHYINGSRQVGLPQPLNRDYEVSMELDADNTWTRPLYNQYFIPGSTFNMMLEITDTQTGAGSRDMFTFMSGCKVMDMEAPEVVEGINAQTITIAPRVCNAEVNDTIQLYNQS